MLVVMYGYCRGVILYALHNACVSCRTIYTTIGSTAVLSVRVKTVRPRTSRNEQKYREKYIYPRRNIVDQEKHNNTILTVSVEAM